MAADDRIERGEDAGPAREAALREFGNVALVEDVTRDVWGWRWLDELRYDLRFALRRLRNNPGFTAIALFTLMLGIGANTAIFSVINAVLLRPLPYPHSDRLVYLSERTPQIRFLYISLPDFQDWLARNTVFEAIGGYRATDATLTGVGEARHLKLRQVTPGLFTTLSARPVLGRLLTAHDDQPGATPVVLPGLICEPEQGSAKTTSLGVTP